jgi:hypothetical protein
MVRELQRTRKVPRGREDEERLTADTIALARQYGRYGYRKIAPETSRPCAPQDIATETQTTR